MAHDAVTMMWRVLMLVTPVAMPRCCDATTDAPVSAPAYFLHIEPFADEHAAQPDALGVGELRQQVGGVVGVAGEAIAGQLRQQLRMGAHDGAPSED